jgi:hypothetical protein
LILLPEGLENTKTNRKSWAEKVMNAAKSVGIWRFAPVFEYAGDESNSKGRKCCGQPGYAPA